MKDWVLVKGRIVSDGEEIDIRGVNPWDFKWTSTGEPPILVEHQQYKDEIHEMHIYEIKNGDKSIRFAAGEFSNVAWGFYVQEEDNRN